MILIINWTKVNNLVNLWMNQPDVFTFYQNSSSKVNANHRFKKYRDKTQQII